MVKKLIKLLFNSGKKATEASGKSMEFIDDLLEKEYITSAVDNLKTSSGKIVEQAGMVYQKTKDTVEANIDIDKIKSVGEDLIEKSKEGISDLTDSMEDSSSTIKSVFDEGEKMVKGIIDKFDGDTTDPTDEEE
jgi:hypothetical protein